MFIFVLQGLWLYISELAGKQLDASVTAKFIIYYMPRLIPLVVPLTVLLSSIMVFGKFAENYEFAAMKSTGISLQRAMRSLSVFIVILGIGCFFFANNVIPWGEFQFINLRKNIAKVKPALAIAENQFTEIGDINIKVDKKHGEKGNQLVGVIIHPKSKAKPGNYKVVKAEKGEIISSDASNVLKLKLYNGNYYEEIVSKKSSEIIKKPHTKTYFKEYITNIDLEVLNEEDLDKKQHSDRYNMLNIKQLNYTIDSLKIKQKKNFETLASNLLNRSTYNTIGKNININKNYSLYNGEVLDIFEKTPNKLRVLSSAINAANSPSRVLNSNIKSLEGEAIWLNKHIISLHDKFVLAISCIILFFVGAPLGALIRKGGMGLPIVIAVVLFLTYHFFGIFAKNAAEKGSYGPTVGAWLSTAIMLPLSIYLTSRATKDKGVFQFDIIAVPIKQLFSKNDYRLSESEMKIYNQYKKQSVEELVSIIKKQGDYDLDKKPKKVALNSLLDRKIPFETLKSSGLEIPSFLVKARDVFKKYLNFSKISLISFTIGAVLLILHFVFKNNKLPEIAQLSLIVSFISFALCVLFIILNSIFYNKYYAVLNKKKPINVIVYFLLSILYPLKYIIVKNKVEQDLFLSSLQNIK